MRLLAIETATELCSVALYVNGAITERQQLAARGHADLVLGFCDELLSDAGLKRTDLDGIAFGRGPGGFTGLRIAVGVVQGIAFGLDRPAVPVSTLAALAQRAWREHGWSQVMAALDARMGEVYSGAFEIRDGLAQLVEPERLSVPEAVSVPDESWYGAGSAWGAYGERLPKVAGVDGGLLPSAYDVAVLGAAALARGEGIPADQALPIYLRDEVVHRKG